MFACLHIKGGGFKQKKLLIFSICNIRTGQIQFLSSVIPTSRLRCGA
jgi:hypothetical protein